MNLELNKSYHGFKLIDKHRVEEIDSLANIFVHEKSGARLLHLENDDDDKVFSVAFRTPPKDSTGVPHIVEHCVLSGSRKYKTKEPFMDMVKGSLKTFINAMTFSDKTIYPVSSKNEKDFTNLMDVYLDSVFYPMIHEDDTIFMQEGWHYEINETDEPITYKGVVYNEMRGAYSSPNAVLFDYIGQSLFPDTTYKNSSGGNPDVIPNLSIEEFKSFHKELYHPSNSYIYIYGNGDIDNYLSHINDEYLSNFDEIEVKSKIDIQKPLKNKVELDGVYSISNDESEENKTYLSMNYILGLGSDPKARLLADVLKEVLVSSSAGPIKKSLLDKKIGQDIMCSVSGGVQITLSFIAKNAELNQKDEFEKTINETLNKLIEDGIEKDLIESCININEYDLREATGFATKGIIYHIASMDSWLYDGEPTEMISYNKDIKFLRDNINTDFYENKLKELFIENSHKSLVTLSPKKGLSEEKVEAIKLKLEKYKENLSEEELNELIEKNKKLKDKQLSPDSKEALDTIPKLEVSDVDKKAEIIPREVTEVDGIKIVNHEIFSNNISYIEYVFDTSMIKKEDIQYVALLSELIGELDTESFNYSDLSNQIYKLTGGINSSTRVYSDYNDGEKYYPKLVLSGKTLSDKTDNLLNFFNILIKEMKLEDKNRIKELLLQTKSRLEMAINRRGDSYASRRLASYLLSSSNYTEKMKGFEYFWFVSDIVKDFDENFDEIINKLKKVYAKVFNLNNLIISFTGDKDSFEIFKDNYSISLKDISKEKYEKEKYDFELDVLNEGVTSSSDVQYVTKGYNFKKLGYKYSGVMQVVKTILNNEYLHNRIRAKGGAYGCGIAINNNGNMIASSYRDPNLSETINVYNEIYKYIEELDLEQEDLTKFIIGAISRLDGAMTAKVKGAVSTANYIANVTQENIQSERDEILNVTVEDIKALSNIFKDVMENDCICTYGNDVKLKTESDLFNELVQLNR